MVSNGFKWERLKRGGAFNDGRHRPKIRVAASGRCQISKMAYEAMEEPLFVRVFFDKQQQSLCLRPFDTEESDCYKVSSHRGNSYSVNAVGLNLHMPPGDYEYEQYSGGPDDYVFRSGSMTTHPNTKENI